jgi:hypothetical protein
VWAGHSKPVLTKPHKRDGEAWKVIKQVSNGPLIGVQSCRSSCVPKSLHERISIAGQVKVSLRFDGYDSLPVSEPFLWKLRPGQAVSELVCILLPSP